MITYYEEDYHVKERLASVPEDQKDDIEKFTRNIFVSYDMDTAIHLHFIHILNNPWVTECFTKCSTEAFGMFEKSEADEIVKAAEAAVATE